MAKKPTSHVTLLDRVVGYISPRAGYQRYVSRQLLTRAYAAASPSDTWRPRRPGASANADHMADAAAIRAKSRYLKQNVPYIHAGMEARVAQSVGTGIIPKFGGKSGDKLQSLWKAWESVCDADGRLDVYGLQAAAVRALDQDGEVLVRIRSRRASDGLPVPLQLQLLEIDWLDNIRTRSEGSNQVIEGKEYDPLGRCVAYWLWDQHPGDIGMVHGSRIQSRRVPAEQILHIFAPLRPGQGRGFPRLAPVINRVRDLELLEDAEIARKNLEGRLSVLATGDVAAMANPMHGGADGNGFGSKDAINPGSLGEFAAGGITQLPPGLNLTVVEPKAAPGFVEYCKYNVHLICAGGGFTYEQATGDMSQVNFSSARVRLLDFRREIEQLQWHVIVPMLCNKITSEFARHADLAGLLGPSAQYTVEHSTPRWEYVNPEQDIKADISEIASGLSSYSEKLRRRGYDPKTVFDELERDVKDLKARGIWDALAFLLKGSTPKPGEDAAQQPTDQTSANT